MYSRSSMQILPSFAANTHCDAGENFSGEAKIWMTDNGIKSSSSTPHEPWQNGRAEVQIRVLLNIARTNMIASGLTGKFWARAIFYAADISNIQCRVDLKMSPHESLYGTKPTSVSVNLLARNAFSM